MGGRKLKRCSVVALGFIFLGQTDEKENNVALFCKVAGVIDEKLRNSAALFVVAGSITRLEALFDKCAESVRKLGRINLRGACALITGGSCKLADNGNFLTLFKRKNAVIVLEQHH